MNTNDLEVVMNTFVRRALYVLHVFSALTMFQGGGALAWKPDGSVFQMPLSWLEHAPFTTYFWPGVILFAVGVVHAVALFLVAKRHPIAWFVSGAAGMGTAIWIGVQMAMVQKYFFLQPIYLVIGLTTAALALALRSSRPAAEPKRA